MTPRAQRLSPAPPRHAAPGYGIDRQSIAKAALLGRAQSLWSFVPPGGKDHLDFGEQFPYDPEKAKALLKEAGFDETNPWHCTTMAHGAEPALPLVATAMKTHYAKIGVDVTVEVIDRRLFLRRFTKDRDGDQVVNFSGAALDGYAYTRSYPGGE